MKKMVMILMAFGAVVMGAGVGSGTAAAVPTEPSAKLEKPAKQTKPDTIGTQELETALKAKTIVLVDARVKKEDDKRRLPGAIMVSASARNATIANALPNKKAAVVLYGVDTACPRAAALWKRLVNMGYTNIRTYPDGIKGWSDAGKPVETVGSKSKK